MPWIMEKYILNYCKMHWTKEVLFNICVKSIQPFLLIYQEMKAIFFVVVFLKEAGIKL